MKIEKFLNWIQYNLMNYPDIDFKTVKMFSDKFFSFLSEKEKDRHYLAIQVIREISLKQISIDNIVLNSKIEIIENKLNKIKKE